MKWLSDLFRPRPPQAATWQSLEQNEWMLVGEDGRMIDRIWRVNASYPWWHELERYPNVDDAKAAAVKRRKAVVVAHVLSEGK